MTVRASFFPALAIGSLFFPLTIQGQQVLPEPGASPPAEHRGAEATITLPSITEEDLDRLKATLPRLRAKLKADFENSAEWKAAVAAVKKSTREYEAPRRAALTRVRATAEYERISRKYEQARREYDALAARSADAAASERLLQQLLAARAAMGKLEAEELKNDSEVSAARQASVKARNDLAALRKRFEETCESHPEWTSRIQQINSAESALAIERLVREQERDREQREALYQYQREEEERAFRREVILNLAAQRVLLERQIQFEQHYTPWSRWYAAGPAYVSSHQGACQPRFQPRSYSYAPAMVYRQGARPRSQATEPIAASPGARSAPPAPGPPSAPPPSAP
jgi:hypothetical protein